MTKTASKRRRWGHPEWARALPGWKIRQLAQLFSKMEYRAKVRGLAWELTPEEFTRLVLLPCEYCESPPANVQERAQVKNLPALKYNGLDRVDNQKGYWLKNVVPCCGFCNRLKSDQLTGIETKALIALLRKLRGGPGAS